MFRTFFDRGSRGFYFEFVSLSDRFFELAQGVVWQHPGATTAKRWWTTKPDEVEELALPRALRAFAGVSSRTSWLVTSLLLGDDFFALSLPYRIAGTAVINGTPSIHLIWQDGESSVSAWFRKSDYALVRFSERDVVPIGPSSVPGKPLRTANPQISENTIDFYPVFNESLAPSDFTFSPPQAAAPADPSRE
jgi:hypothetical protein